MNGIILKTFVAGLMISTTAVFAENGGAENGVEFGWRQLPDGRVEYVIQLDDRALSALRNGEPLTSSLPPDVKNADRIRVQYGTETLAKPILLKKPQAFNNSVSSAPIGSAGNQNFQQSNFQNPGTNSVADTRPSLNPNDLNSNSANSNNANSNGFANGTTGQVKYSSGNTSVVSNSSLTRAQPTSFVTPQDGNRMVQNIDDQPPRNVADRRMAAPTGMNPTNLNNNTGNTTGFDPRGTGAGGANTNPNYAPGSTQSNIYGNNSGMAPVNNGAAAAGNNWQSPENPANNNYNNAVGNYKENVGGTNPAVGVRSNATNFYPPNGTAPATGPYPNNNYNPYGAPGTSGSPPVQPYPYPTYPVTTPTQPNQDVAELTKQLEEMKNQAREKEQADKIAEMRLEQEKKIKELEQRLEKNAEKQKEKTDDKPVTQLAGLVSDDKDSNGGNSVAITIFLLFSIGLNVFLVVQYLSVQNQFRDLSNDLRDSFMANNYE